MTTRRHWGIDALAILAIGPNLMLRVAVMLMQDLVQNSFATGSYAPMWVVNSGNLAFALFAPVGPFLMRRIGLRSTYVPPMIVFLLGSLICSLSPTIVWLGVGRFLEGMAAGTVFMMMIPTLILSFPAGRRNRVLAVLVIGFFGFVAMGPVLGSLTLLEDAWRWLFVAVGLLALGGTLMGRTLPKTIGPPPNQNGAAAGSPVLDTSGLLLTVATCLSLAITLGNLVRWGLSSPQFSIPAIISAVFFVLFVWVELSISNTLVPFGLVLMKPSFRTMMAVLSNISMILALAMLSVVLRSVEAFSNGAITSFYLSLLPGVVLSAVLMTVFHDRVGPGVLGIAGSLCLMNVPYQWLSVEKRRRYGHLAGD